jgi:hypothetical protein
MKPNLLFVSEKWTDGRPELGATNSSHNLFNTFQQARPDFNLINLYLDESESVYGRSLDDILPEFCLRHNIKIIMFCLMNGAKGNPSLECYQKLKNLGCYLIFHWPDCGSTFGSQTIKQLGDLAYLHCLWDNGITADNQFLVSGQNIMRMWVPQDRSLFFIDKQTIPVSFVGTTKNYNDRNIFLNYLSQNTPNIDIFIGGGQRTSKINLNFSVSLAQFWQIKGRVFEILASGSLLLELKNPATERLFKSDFDYVDFSNPKEMVDKINYYLEHENERKKIAEQGYKTYNKYYTAQIFWDNIIEKTLQKA